MTEREIQMLADSCTDVVMKHFFPLRYDICDNIEEDEETNKAYETLNEKFYEVINSLQI